MCSPLLVPEGAVCCHPWRPCCCSRSCAHRPPACASVCSRPAPISSVTIRWSSGSGATSTNRVTPWRTAGGPSRSPRTISPPPLLPPSPVGKKGLQVPLTTASSAGRGSEGSCSTTAPKGTGGAGWLCPWTSRPTSWTSSSMWPKPKTCAPRRPRTRGSWRRSDGGSEEVELWHLTCSDQCWPPDYEMYWMTSFYNSGFCFFLQGEMVFSP